MSIRPRDSKGVQKWLFIRLIWNLSSFRLFPSRTTWTLFNLNLVLLKRPRRSLGRRASAPAGYKWTCHSLRVRPGQKVVIINIQKRALCQNKVLTEYYSGNDLLETLKRGRLWKAKLTSATVLPGATSKFSLINKNINICYGKKAKMDKCLKWSYPLKIGTSFLAG